MIQLGSSKYKSCTLVKGQLGYLNLKLHPYQRSGRASYFLKKIIFKKGASSLPNFKISILRKNDIIQAHPRSLYLLSMCTK